MSAKPTPTLDKKATVEDEEDLDDLDDVLNEFTPSVPPPTSTSKTFTPSGTRPRNNTRVDAPPSSTPGLGPPLPSTSEEAPEIDEDLLSSEFAKELAKGMESLMREISAEAGLGGEVPAATAGADPAKPGEEDEEQQERARAFKAAWEAMLVEGMSGKGGEEEEALLGMGEGFSGTGSRAPPTTSTTAPGGGTDFQAQIKQAMERLKAAEGQAKAAESSSSGAAGAAGVTPESMEDLLKTLGDLGLGDLGLDGTEGDSELAGFLESMMGQLMNKDVLYDPLKELGDGFPGYLANPPKPLSDEDKSRYEKQLECVKKILAVFEAPGYSDEDPESSKKIVDLMSEMQSYGSPPSEIMGPLPPGFDAANGGFPGLNPNDPECTIA